MSGREVLGGRCQTVGGDVTSVYSLQQSYNITFVKATFGMDSQ